MTNNEREAGRWEKPLADWRRIFAETPDYDCWPAPIRGWEVGALVGRIDDLVSRLAEAEARASRAEAEELELLTIAHMMGAEDRNGLVRLLRTRLTTAEGLLRKAYAEIGGATKPCSFSGCKEPPVWADIDYDGWEQYACAKHKDAVSLTKNWTPSNDDEEKLGLSDRIAIFLANDASAASPASEGK